MRAGSPLCGEPRQKDSPGEDGENRRVRTDYTPCVYPGVHDVTWSKAVSEGGLEPPPPYRGLGPQPSASTNSATPTWQPAEYTRDIKGGQRRTQAVACAKFS